MTRKFPFDKNKKHHLWVAFGLVLWIFLFLFFTEPFDINKFSNKEKLLFLPFYGLIQGITYLITLLYQNAILKKQQSWFIKNEILFLLILAITGSIINFLFYKNVIVYNEQYTYDFITYQKLIFLPALTIILPFILLCRYILGLFSSKTITEKQINIQGEGKHDFIQLKPQELLFVQSSDNYIEINYLEKNQIKKKLIRANLTDVSNSIPELLKTHRSFLINPIHFRQLKIENKKHFIDLGYDILIPVSRSLQSDIKNQLQLTTNK